MYNIRPQYLLAIGIMLLLGAGCSGTDTPTPTSTNPNDNGSNPPATSTDPEVPNTSPVTIDMPSAYSTVESPMEISGMIPGNWATEGQLYITLESSNGSILADTNAQVDNWMTTDMVPFTAMLTYTASEQVDVEIIIHKGNPSGLPANDMMVSWPVTILPSGQLSLGSWQEVTVQNSGVVLMIPSEFESNETPGGMQFLYTGPSQREATELYDGISVTLNVFDGAANTAQSVANEQYSQDNSSGVKRSIDTTIRQTAVGEGIPAYTYQYSSLAVIDRYFFETNANTVVMLSIVVPDPSDLGYDSVVGQIRDSIQFVE